MSPTHHYSCPKAERSDRECVCGLDALLVASKRLRTLEAINVRWSGASPAGDRKRPYWAQLKAGKRSTTATGATLVELADVASEWLDDASGVQHPEGG